MYLQIVELRHTQEWTSSHLQWFNISFSPHLNYNIPLPPSTPLKDTEPLLAKVVALVNEYKEFLAPQQWNHTTHLGEKGKSAGMGDRPWIEVSARPAYMTQLFGFSVVSLLVKYLGNEMGIERYLPCHPSIARARVCE